MIEKCKGNVSWRGIYVVEMESIENVQLRRILMKLNNIVTRRNKMSNMMEAIRFEQYGDADVLQYVTVERPEIGDREVLVEVKAIGVNYADIARRRGQYVVPTPLPFIPGSEIAGQVVAVGKDVELFQEGERVVSLINDGAYATFAKAHELGLAKIPDEVSYQDAVALPLQGQTAYHILKTMGRIEEGDTVLVHAAAGGVGALSVQLAKEFGASKVIATASNEEKLNHAKKLGADFGVNYTEENWALKVRELTDGKGVDIALEMVGGDIFNKTLHCLAPFGRLVIFGGASGEPAHLNAAQLMRRNHSVVGFFLPVIMKDPVRYQKGFTELLQYYAAGKLQLTVGGVYPLVEAAKVHTLLESRQTIGKLILEP